jgi:hypothetical protein
MLIINTSSIKLEVKINAPHGVDYVHLQPKGRAHLDADHTVDSNWKASEGSALKIIDDTPVATAVAASVVTRKASVVAASSTADKE